MNLGIKSLIGKKNPKFAFIKLIFSISDENLRLKQKDYDQFEKFVHDEAFLMSVIQDDPSLSSWILHAATVMGFSRSSNSLRFLINNQTFMNRVNVMQSPKKKHQTRKKGFGNPYIYAYKTDQKKHAFFDPLELYFMSLPYEQLVEGFDEIAFFDLLYRMIHSPNMQKIFPKLLASLKFKADVQALATEVPTLKMDEGDESEIELSELKVLVFDRLWVVAVNLAMTGEMELLQFLLSENSIKNTYQFRIDYENIIPRLNDACVIAAKGHPDYLRWMLQLPAEKLFLELSEEELNSPSLDVHFDLMALATHFVPEDLRDQIVDYLNHYAAEPDELLEKIHPIHLAAIAGDVNYFDDEVKSEALDLPSGESQLRPLHLAIFGKNPSFLDRLIESRANVNLPNKFGVIPLMQAIGVEQEDTVKRLLEAQSDPFTEIETDFGDAPRRDLFSLSQGTSALTLAAVSGEAMMDILLGHLPCFTAVNSNERLREQLAELYPNLQITMCKAKNNMERFQLGLHGLLSTKIPVPENKEELLPHKVVANILYRSGYGLYKTEQGILEEIQNPYSQEKEKRIPQKEIEKKDKRKGKRS